MSNDLTVQSYNAPAIYDAFDHDEPDTSPVRGSRYKFDGGAYFTGGKDKTAVDTTDRSYVVLDKAQGWQFLKAGCQPEWVMHVAGQPKPERPDCGDEADWPLDLSGNPSAPWKFVQWIYLLDAESGETVTFEGGSVGSKLAIDDLTKQIKSMRSMQPGAMPVIQLQSIKFPTKFGAKLRPNFKVVSWRNRAAVADEPPPQLEAPEYDNSREHEDVEF